ncbi:hypothetical protein CEXT_445171 [Caerostris extrusa]|uniref:Uncharacterized protein n=1 Tax=Caerostris extrusa TaxID=172846 RepID=A0AAV4XE11_CAEEX|nr:hypothetical protein CEXT_445171 [Caerostris extrusa]
MSADCFLTTWINGLGFQDHTITAKEALPFTFKHGRSSILPCDSQVLHKRNQNHYYYSYYFKNSKQQNISSDSSSRADIPHRQSSLFIKRRLHHSHI